MNILIVDENPIFSRGLCSLIGEKVTAAFEFQALTDVVHWCKGNPSGPKILLIDNSLAVRKLSYIEEYILPIKNMKCVSLLSLLEQPFSKHLMQKGFIGAVKRVDINEITRCIEMIQKERIYISSDILASLLGTYHDDHITSNPVQNILNDKEKSILKLTYEEYSSKQIADKLSLSTRTVEWHRQKMMEKTGSKNMIGLIRFGIETNILNAYYTD